MKNRAKAGGETGMNGLQYEGGQFLPTTELSKIAKAEKKIDWQGRRARAKAQVEAETERIRSIRGW